MNDIDTIKKILDASSIIYNEGWNRNILLGESVDIVRWIIIPGKFCSTRFNFYYDGRLESITPENGEDR